MSVIERIQDQCRSVSFPPYGMNRAEPDMHLRLSRRIAEDIIGMSYRIVTRSVQVRRPSHEPLNLHANMAISSKRGRSGNRKRRTHLPIIGREITLPREHQRDEAVVVRQCGPLSDRFPHQAMRAPPLADLLLSTIESC